MKKWHHTVLRYSVWGSLFALLFWLVPSYSVTLGIGLRNVTKKEIDVVITRTDKAEAFHRVLKPGAIEHVRVWEGDSSDRRDEITFVISAADRNGRIYFLKALNGRELRKAGRIEITPIETDSGERPEKSDQRRQGEPKTDNATR